jgi:hypothetical protein
MASQKTLNIRYDNYTLEEIKQTYFLNDLIGKNYDETENVAALIKQIYLYSGLYNSKDIDQLSKKLISREVIITVFSVLEATQSSIAKKIQMLCKNCKKRCPLYSVDLLKIEPKFRSEESFRFLSKARIINYSKKDFEFYMFIKNLRNNIHLVEIGQQISNYPYYDEKYVNLSVEFMGIALNIYKVNLEKHLNNLGCYRRQ